MYEIIWENYEWLLVYIHTTGIYTITQHGFFKILDHRGVCRIRTRRAGEIEHLKAKISGGTIFRDFNDHWQLVKTVDGLSLELIIGGG
jgi:hypothetical protein